MGKINRTFSCYFGKSTVLTQISGRFSRYSTGRRPENRRQPPPTAASGNHEVKECIAEQKLRPSYRKGREAEQKVEIFLSDFRWYREVTPHRHRLCVAPIGTRWKGWRLALETPLHPPQTTNAVSGKRHSRRSFRNDLRKRPLLYLLLVPVVVYFITFKYVPLYGEIIAFKQFRLADGIWGSKWVGLEHFERLLHSSDFLKIVRNTLLLNVYALVFGFPAPIVLALLLNEMRVEWYKRLIQNLLYLPHFLSWIILGMIVIGLLSPSVGFINHVLKAFGMEPIYFMSSNFWWPLVYVFAGIWREAGFGTILYLAAMAAIDPHLFEAARMDGAGKLRQMWHVTLPGIRSTIALMLVLQMGRMTDVGFEQVWVLTNPMVTGVSDVMSTYIYRLGLVNLQYSYTTAIGLFQSLIGFALVLTVNRIIRAMGERALW
ncbi:MAG: sugar ABC transporter permease [Paenibacillaceae bacterium]|nr:sugar ABC transporter permease [Paenibacillaceae bacterium]